MSFKHTKFEDSPTMRSLVKVAKEKGLFQETALVKTASEVEKPDYSPSGNLTENILKLCSGLRNLGFENQANELEANFMNYKVASSIYETSNETGEDIIDQAHPKGSHKLDVDGDGVVETILDQHLKMINMVNKKPTGKLATNRDILNAVKVVVAQELTAEQLIASLKFNANGVLEAYNNVSSLTRTGTNLPEQLVQEVNSVNSNNLNDDILNSIYDKTNGIISVLKPGVLNYITDVLNIGITDSDWKIISGKLYGVQNAVIKLKNILKNPPQPVVKSVDPQIDAFNKKLDKMLSIIKSWKSIVESDPSSTPEEKVNGGSWLDAKRTDINNIKVRFEALDDGAKLESLNGQERRLNEVIKDFSNFKKTWID